MKTLIISLLLLLAISCTKENLTNPSITAENSDAEITSFVLGQRYQGGKIFYIDGTGLHGLIVASRDQGNAIQWFNGTYIATGAVGRAIGTGSANTTFIISKQGNTGVYAAKLCRDYRGGGFADWFLPSADELTALYDQKLTVGIKSSGRYWSSTDGNLNNVSSPKLAGSLGFDPLKEAIATDKAKLFRVRAIRKF